MERKAGASPSAGSLSGWRQNIPSRALTRGGDREAAGEGTSSFRSSCPARDCVGADLGLSPESLPPMPSDSVQSKLTDAPWDTAHLCILLWARLFCWELSVGWVLTRAGRTHVWETRAPS